MRLRAQGTQPRHAAVHVRRAIRHNSAQSSDDLFTPLRYTPIHEQYVALAETELQAGLLEGMGGGFDIVEFLSKVPAWVESGEVTDDEQSSETLEVLTSFTSFESFKELMLARKAEKEGGGGAAAVFGDVSLEADMEALVASMSSAAWKPVKRMKTMVLERAKDEKGGESCRFVLEAPIPPEHGLLLMLGATEERKQWDKHVTWTRLDEGSGYSGDFHMCFKVPMAKPMELTVRMFVKHDFPNPGDHTWVYRGLTKEREFDMSPGAPVGKGYIKGVDGDPNSCVIVSVEELPKMMARMPKFLVNWLLASFTPKYLTTMVLKYKAFKGL